MRIRSPLTTALIAIIFGWAPAANAGEPLELAVKATYLYKLAPFVDWRPGTFPDPAGPFTLCVIGDDPFGPVLDRAVMGQRVDNHPIVVRRLPTATPKSDCALAFVAGSKSQSVKDGLRQLIGTSVLTVTDNQSSPGIVDFVNEDGRVRLRIDDEAAQTNGLEISSKLLKLATSVVPRRAKNP